MKDVEFLKLASKKEVTEQINEAVESFEKGTWTFPGLTKAVLLALKYLVENTKEKGEL